MTLEPFLSERAKSGEREFLIVPLFFGESRALTDFIPDCGRRVSAARGALRITRADVLCPLPRGEPGLVDILLENIESTEAGRTASRTVVLVDHGSPLPSVTAVRSRLADGLAERIGHRCRVMEAVMERRRGSEYDFNGPLLEDVLEGLAREPVSGPITVAMQFILPGRHAGPDGDVAQICGRVTARHPGFQVRQSSLIADHPGLVDILASRARAALVDTEMDAGRARCR